MKKSLLIKTLIRQVRKAGFHPEELARNSATEKHLCQPFHRGTFHLFTLFSKFESLTKKYNAFNKKIQYRYISVYANN